MTSLKDLSVPRIPRGPALAPSDASAAVKSVSRKIYSVPDEGKTVPLTPCLRIPNNPDYPGPVITLR